MNNEIFEALNLLEKERGIPVDFMLEKIRKAILTACKNSYGNEDAVIDVTFVDEIPVLASGKRKYIENLCPELVNGKSGIR